MSCWYFLIIHILFVSVIAHEGHILTVDGQQDERIRLECTLTSKADAEDAMWMRIRPPHNPDILTYRDNVVYAPDRIELQQRRLSSSINTNGTFIDTYFLTLTILRPNIDDEGRYICSKGRTVYAEYDLFIIVPPRFIDQKNLNQQQIVIEGSTLHLFCSAEGRPMPSITWYYRTNNGKHILLGDGTDCREPVCELHLGNYTRHDPTIIECIADNEKSSRISKVFNIDVYYPPKITTNIRTLKDTKSIDVFLECSSVGNPSPSISWFDDNQQEINNHHLYTIKIENQSSILSFSILSKDHSKVLYYCRSNNSVGTVEKLINISDFIQFDFKTTTMQLLTTTLARKQKIVPTGTRRPNRTRSTLSTTTTVSSNSSTFCYSNILFLIFIIRNFIK